LFGGPFAAVGSLPLLWPLLLLDASSVTADASASVKRLGSRYRSGHSRDWLKSKNPAAPAMKREKEEDWGKGPALIRSRVIITGISRASAPTRRGLVFAAGRGLPRRNGVRHDRSRR